jgi:predicted RNA-binding Zn ribbon-like protein
MQIPESIRRIELDGGHPALDFVNTLHSWVEPSARDYWASPIELVAWHRHVALIDRATADAFVRLPPRSAARVLARASGARSKLHELFAGIAATGRPPPAELKWLDAQLAALARFRHLRRDRAGAVAWVARPEPSRPDSLLAPALFAAAELLTTADLTRIKACPPPDGCGWLFLDTSRNGKRTWCSMKTCGNAAKVRRFRQRRRT